MAAIERDSLTGLPVGPEVEAVPAKRPWRATLPGRFVTLAPIEAAHADALYRNSHGPEREALWLYLGSPPFADRASFGAYVAKAAVSADPFFFAVLMNGTGEAVGHATLMRIEPAPRVIEVGNILYTPKLQRTAGATEAMYLLARHVFEDLGYRRYEWKCNVLNAPSRRAAERLGFTFEGVFRQHMIVKGRSRDTAWYAMLDRDWPACKAAFEVWLAPENFDAAGRQRRALASLRESAQ